MVSYSQAFERRRGANYMQMFMEEAVAEIMEGGGATRTAQKLVHVQKLLEDVLLKVQQLSQKVHKSGGGRDVKSLTRLRAGFLMISRADRRCAARRGAKIACPPRFTHAVHVWGAG